LACSLSTSKRDKLFPCSKINGINKTTIPVNNPNKINIVAITAKVFGSFNLVLKKRINGLPINDKTPAIII
jgi:hypothetical protein